MWLKGMLNACVAFGFLAITPLSGQSEVFVDSFDVGAFSLSLGPNDSQGFAHVNADATQVLGGKRSVTIYYEENYAVPHSTAGLQVGNGFLDYNRNQNGYFYISYGYYTSTPLNANLAQGGNDRFSLNILNAPGPFQLRLTVRDNAFFGSNESEAVISGSGPGLYQLPFSSFGSVEFDKVAGVQLLMAPIGSPNNGPGLYRFDYFSAAAVPEPRAYSTAICLSLIAFGAIRRYNLNR